LISLIWGAEDAHYLNNEKNQAQSFHLQINHEHHELMRMDLHFCL